MLILRLKQLKICIFLFLFKLFSFFIRSDHWIICERGTDARDNGYSFYKYMKEKHPEQKVYYLITKDSADYNKVKCDAVAFNSVKSFWKIISAKKIISSHYATVLPLYAIKIFNLFRLYDKFYFLQHGVIKDDLKLLYAERAPMKLFVCGGKPEYEDVVANYGHPEGVVKYTGLARFDSLHINCQIQKQILVMPTWRSFIQSRELLLESSYYANWQKLLKNKQLDDVLRKQGIKLVFYVHYEMQKYIDAFQSESDNIIIARFEDYDVQQLLRESALLVTDYSSVFFDFAYMKKPVLYYHFDQNHYEKGYFDYETMGFGKLCTSYDSLVKEICQLINDGCIMESMYLDRANSFFPLYDDFNCDRIYHSILENE